MVAGAAWQTAVHYWKQSKYITAILHVMYIIIHQLLIWLNFLAFWTEVKTDEDPWERNIRLKQTS